MTQWPHQEPEESPQDGHVPIRVPDPGSPSAARFALISAIVLFVTVAAIQWMGSQAPPQGPAPGKPPLVAMPGPDRVVSVKVALAFREMTGKADFPAYAGPDAPVAERVRDAIVYGELEARDRALAELVSLTPDLSTADPALADDVVALSRLYETGSLGVDADTLASMRTRHGWFMSLAEVFGKGESDPARRALLEDARGATVTLGAAMIGVVVVAAIGLVVLIVAGVRLTRGRWRPRFVPPVPGGSVYLEMFPVFILGFLLVSVVGSALIAQNTSANASITYQLVFQWSLVAVLFWPIVRGVGAKRARQDLGWHAGSGVLREIGAGAIGYLATVPAYLGAVVISLVLMSLFGGQSAGGNPVMEHLQGGPAGRIVLLAMLAIMWAPLVEETIFRGGLYRHLRARSSIGAAALITGVLFAFMHGYGPLLTPPLIVLGASFAILREWRGSLVASMTAHVLHNSATLGFALMLVSLGS